MMQSERYKESNQFPRVAPTTQALLDSALVWDNHACMPLRPDDETFLPELERFKRAGVNVVCLNVGFDAVPWENTIRMLAHFRSWIRAHPESLLLVETAADVARAQAEDRLGVCFDIEGGLALNGQISLVELYYKLGVRWMLLAYNRNNALGGGCQEEDHGLTDFGKAVLDEMARVGVVTCCSHTGLRTSLEIMERSPAPVIFSHSNPSAVWQHKRNIPDDAIRACAATNGVVGITGIGAFLGRNDARTETVVRHIDHVVQLVGARHVGFGFDYVFDRDELDAFVANNPQIFPPEQGLAGQQNFVEPEQIPSIVEALLHLGYSDADVRAIAGGNHLRVAQQVWKQD
jgi:membrane dipeptidase